MKKLEQEKQKLVKEVNEVQTKLKVVWPVLSLLRNSMKLTQKGLKLAVSLQILRGKTHKQSKKAKKEIRNIRQKLENTEEFLHKEKQFSLQRILCQQNQNYEDLVVSDLGLETAANSEGIISKQ